MKKTLIYDLPTRLFHWSFAGFFLSAFFIVNIFEDEDPIFSYHMMIGLALAFIVFFRIIWGIIGTKHAHFSSFVLSPVALFNYIKEILTGEAERRLVRNPASSWAALVMIGLSIGLAITGYMMASGNAGDDLEDIHEIMADGFIIVILLHIAGIILHTIRHKENIGKSIITGHKEAIDGDDSTVDINNKHTGVGVLFIILTIGFIFLLNKNYNPDQQTLNLFGMQLQLSEAEDDHHEENDDDD